MNQHVEKNQWAVEKNMFTLNENVEKEQKMTIDEKTQADTYHKEVKEHMP